MKWSSAAWLPLADYSKTCESEGYNDKHERHNNCFENYQNPWSVNDARTKEWPTGEDQIQSNGRKTRFKDEAEGVVVEFF